jgi:hypothetical protein
MIAGKIGTVNPYCVDEYDLQTLPGYREHPPCPCLELKRKKPRKNQTERISTAKRMLYFSAIFQVNPAFS